MPWPVSCTSPACRHLREGLRGMLATGAALTPRHTCSPAQAHLCGQRASHCALRQARAACAHGGRMPRCTAATVAASLLSPPVSPYSMSHHSHSNALLRHIMSPPQLCPLTMYVASSTRPCGHAGAAVLLPCDIRGQTAAIHPCACGACKRRRAQGGQGLFWYMHMPWGMWEMLSAEAAACAHVGGRKGPVPHIQVVCTPSNRSQWHSTTQAAAEAAAQGGSEWVSAEVAESKRPELGAARWVGLEEGEGGRMCGGICMCMWEQVAESET